jgi:nucleotide-binding universal stress UspA family protein
MTTTDAAGRPGQVVVGVDGSDASLRAALWAAERAAGGNGHHRVPLRLVHSYFQPYLYYPPFAVSTTVDNELLATARRELDAVTAAVRSARPDVEVHSVMRTGHPVTTLLAESADARMLVLGARGRHGFEALLLGSVVTPVVSHARCPVAVVRPIAHDRADGPVVVGVDGSPVSEAALALAFDEASARRTGLVAVHAWSDRAEEWMFPVVFDADGLHVAEEDERRLLAERLAGWQEKYPDVAVERAVVRQRPAPALLERAAGAQLLVVGSRGRGGFTGLLLGSTSQAVLHHAPCPVIVVRAGQD